MWFKKSNFVTLSLFAFALFVIADLGEAGGGYSFLKYASIVAISVSMIAVQGFRKSFDGKSSMAIGFFIYFVILFTLLNSPDAGALATILGYFVCLTIYISSSSAGNALFESAERFLLIFAIFFVAINIPQIFDPASYSATKNQFSGVLANANAFAGLCGFLFIFCLCAYRNSVSLLRALAYLAIALILFFYMMLSSSRGAFFAVFLSIFFIPFNKAGKWIFFASAFLYVAAKLYFSQGDFAVGFADRDFSEETGRAELLALYTREIFGNTLIGVGLSESGGRIKSELSYLDILLFAGIGAFGFFVFILRGLYFSVITTFDVKRYGFSWPVPVFIYLCAASIFEGYAANIASLPSIFLYISAGFVFRNFKLGRALRGGVN